MACCKEEIICNIIKQFSINSPCATQMCEVIPAFWDMVSSEACGNCHLTALLTKREAVLFLLGCEAYSVDIAESHYTMSAEAKADSRADSNTQAQATGSSQKRMEAHGETKYDEKSNANSVYNMGRVGRAKEQTDGSSFYRDDGKGFGFNKSESFSFIRNRLSHISVQKDESIGNGEESRRDCNYEYSQNKTFGNGYGIPPVVGSFTSTSSDWRKYQRTNGVNNMVTEFKGSADAKDTDTDLSTTRGIHRWEDTFLADIYWYEKEYIQRFHNERMDSRRVATAHSDGAGNGMHEQKDETNSASQGTSLTVGDSETLRTASRVSNLSAFAIANSQRFTNLEGLYDQLTEQINHVRRRMRSNSKPLLDVIPCACKSECCCGKQLRKIGYECLSNCRTSQGSNGAGMLRYPGIM